MKKSKWIALSLVIAVSIGGVLALRADQSFGENARWGQPSWSKAKAKLGLTNDQIARIKAELRPEKTALITGVLKVNDAKVALREAVERSGVTEAELRAAAAAIGAAEGDLAVLKAKLYARVSPLFTAEQLAKIQAGKQKKDDMVDAATVVFINRLVD